MNSVSGGGAEPSGFFFEALGWEGSDLSVQLRLAVTGLVQGLAKFPACGPSLAPDLFL